MVIGLFCLVAPAFSQDLRIAVRDTTTTIDPHYYTRAPNLQISRHIFETLVGIGTDGQIEPGLAESWKTLDDTTWEFKLRQGVKFHDGSDFNADDVVASVERVKLATGPVTFLRRVAAIDSIEVVDPYTIHIKTKTPWPLLTRDLSNVFITPAEVVNATFDAFDSGKAAIGTGPYKLVSFTPQEQVVLKRNDDYWGTKPDYDNVTIRTIADASAREAALRSGDVDLIEDPAAVNIAAIKNDPNLQVSSALTGFVIYMGYDQINPKTADVTGTDKNPLLDKRVREAFSKAIDRKLVIDRVLLGLGEPASQPLPPGNFGHAEDLKVEAYDPEGAKKLLAEAGYPNGFSIALTVPTGEINNAENVGQAVVAMLQRVGIKATLNVVPGSVFGTAARDHKYSLFLSSYISPEFDGSSAVRALTAIPDKDKGWGTSNYGGYANQASVDLLTQSFNTVDLDKRDQLLQQNIKMVMEDYAVAPLYWQMANWASTRAVNYTARADAETHAMDAHLAK
jgi:peptide/nickel transport system substrate-binding protein